MFLHLFNSSAIHSISIQMYSIFPTYQNIISCSQPFLAVPLPDPKLFGCLLVAEQDPHSSALHNRLVQRPDPEELARTAPDRRSRDHTTGSGTTQTTSNQRQCV